MRFQARMPEVRFELFEGLLPIANPRLRDGSLDFFIGRPQPGSTGVEFQYQPLFSSSCAVAARQGHPRANCRSLAELCDLNWGLTWDPATEGPGVEALFLRHKVPVPAKVQLLHSYAIGVSLLRQSDMVSVFPWPLVEAAAEREGLCAIPVREQLEEAPVGIITRSGSPLSAPAQCLIDCLIEAIRDAMASKSPHIRQVLKAVEVLI